jgi:hypothetical protein
MSQGFILWWWWWWWWPLSTPLALLLGGWSLILEVFILVSKLYRTRLHKTETLCPPPPQEKQPQGRRQAATKLHSAHLKLSLTRDFALHPISFIACWTKSRSKCMQNQHIVLTRS